MSNNRSLHWQNYNLQSVSHTDNHNDFDDTDSTLMLTTAHMYKL